MREFNMIDEKIKQQKELAQIIGCNPTYLSNLLNLKNGFKGSKWNLKIEKALAEAQSCYSLTV